jgi:hypothetical protein
MIPKHMVMFTAWLVAHGSECAIGRKGRIAVRTYIQEREMFGYMVKHL